MPSRFVRSQCPKTLPTEWERFDGVDNPLDLRGTSTFCGYSTGDMGTMSRWRTAMPPSIFTIGHSNHPLEQFLALLAQHEVEALADIRRFPGSRKHPHFNRDNLAAALQKTGVEYRWLEDLEAV